MALLDGLSSVILVPYASRDLNAVLDTTKPTVLNLSNGGPT